jgi:hypothetical protein
MKKTKSRIQPPIELTKVKPRQEEERFFVRFSKTQVNAVLMMILAATFLVQGIVRYLDIVGKIEFLKPWFILVLLAMVSLVTSVVIINLEGIVYSLKNKRKLNLISFNAFILGFVLFLISLLFLMLVVI